MTHRTGFLLLALAAASCSPAEHKSAEAPVRTVVATAVHYAPDAPSRTLPGIVRARVESDLGFRVTGKVSRRAVDTGAVVKAGDVLAELDPIDLGLQMQSAEAELRAAQAAKETTASELARVASLRKAGWSTGSDFDRQRSAAADALSRYDRARRQMDLARNALDYGTLRADADGVITAILAEPGQVVASGQTVMRLARTAEREAAVAVPESLLDDARNDDARVSLWALPGHDVPARLRELSPTADPATRTYAARYAIPDAPPDMRLGMTTTVTLIRPGTAVARLPASAVLDQGHGPTVWVVEPATGALAQRTVTVAAFGQSEVAITGGVSEGETVVTLGAQKLDAGQRVRIAGAA